MEHSEEQMADTLQQQPAQSGRARCGRRGGALLEPVVLAALLRTTAYGYDLRRVIDELTHGEVAVDAGGLYRTLRQLEQDGFVVSTWADGDAGPQRREYDITDQGCALAAEWATHLRARAHLTAFVADIIDRTFKEDSR